MRCAFIPRYASSPMLTMSDSRRFHPQGWLNSDRLHALDFKALNALWKCSGGCSGAFTTSVCTHIFRELSGAADYNTLNNKPKFIDALFTVLTPTTSSQQRKTPPNRRQFMFSVMHLVICSSIDILRYVCSNSCNKVGISAAAIYNSTVLNTSLICDIPQNEIWLLNHYQQRTEPHRVRLRTRHFQCK